MDGTVGAAGALSGPNYTIPSTLGTTRGNNLFQSFGQFDLSQGDVATFTGPANIKNILARVTGGSASTIDGTIDTTAMPTANFFFINPFGVTFGQHATINVGGSVAITTADYVKLADGGRFDARNPANDILTAAPVSAFGFLGPAAAPVTLNGPGGVDDQPSLAIVPAGQSIVIVAGDIQIANMGLAAPGGRVALVSVASAGEANLNLDDPTSAIDVSGFSQLGNISLTDNSGCDVSGPGAGLIFVRAENLTLDNSYFIFENNGAQNGLGLDVNVSGTFELVDHGVINGVIYGSGNGGNVSLTAGTIQITGGEAGGSSIQMGTYNDATTGNGGNVVIQAGTFAMGAYSGITMLNAGSGTGGNLTINANSVVIDAENTSASIGTTTYDGIAGSITINADTVLVANGAELNSYSYGSAAGGVITIAAHELSLLNGGAVAVSAYQSGAAGKISISADTFLIDSQNGIFGLTGLDAETDGGDGRGGDIQITAGTLTLANASQITAGSGGNGPGGNITIQADTLTLGNGSLIASSASGSGPAGNLNLTVTQSLQLNGGADYGGSSIASSGYDGAGGSIAIHAGDATLTGGSLISSSSYGTGSAGGIQLAVAGSVLLNEGSSLSVSAAQTDGGDITVTAGKDIELNNAQITAEASLDGGNIHLTAPTRIYLLDSQVSAAADTGNGGNVVIDPTFVVLNRSSILGSAVVGNGGNINITSQYYLPSDSTVNASSEFGLQGTVTINTLDAYYSVGLLPLDAQILDATTLLRPACAVRLPQGISSFTVTGRGGWPIEPDALQPAFPVMP